MILQYLIPIILLLPLSLAVCRSKDGYTVLQQGCRDGLSIVVSILPALVLLLTAVKMLQASGAQALLSRVLAPLLEPLGIPRECAILVLIRPISGSAALAVGTELMRTHGVDSLVGRTAAVMLGSTETTFYTISVYFGGAGIQKTRFTIPAALFADLTGFVTAAVFVRLFYH